MKGQPYLRLRYRYVDRPVAAVLFALALPILLIALLWSWMVGRSSPLYSVRRVGQSGKEFTLHKVRTFHRAHSEATFPRRADGSYTSTVSHSDLLWGASLVRQLGIDEIPQLLNIIKGEMAILGPRPLPLEMAIDWTMPDWALPGLSGSAQVVGRRATSMKDRDELNHQYLLNASPLVDTHILLATCQRVFLGGE